jgi:hypothetical protein
VDALNLELEPPLAKLADKICISLLNTHPIEEIMEFVKKHKEKSVYVYAERSNPSEVKLLVDSKKRYRCDDVLLIPVPKKFAVLEPDKLYFEMTLKANIFLAVQGAEERELHH